MGDSSQSFGAWFEKLQKKNGGEDVRIATEETVPLMAGGASDDEGSAMSARLSDSWNFLRQGAGSVVGKIQEKVSGSPSRAATGADVEKAEGGEAVADSSSSSLTNCGWATLSRSDRFKGFVVLMAASAFFFVMAMMMLSVVLISPSKFAVSFTLGSACFMGSFAMYKGPWTWLKSVCSKDNILFTLCYFGSMGATLYACLSIRSYILTIAFSVVQMLALGFYGTSHIPGGQAGMWFFTRMVGKTMKACATGSAKCFGRMLVK